VAVRGFKVARPGFGARDAIAKADHAADGAMVAWSHGQRRGDD